MPTNPAVIDKIDAAVQNETKIKYRPAYRAVGWTANYTIYRLTALMASLRTAYHACASNHCVQDSLSDDTFGN